ncbi:MAG: ABC transporter ATP-binding protein [Phyllobacteriaceae bacterium]|jgi:peptide/nickel transport system ATP-binding protein|nr:ABC transporter ATP-binding protein [Phyllobacteriaceae bacterium]
MNDLIKVEGLRTHFFTDEGVVKAVDGVEFSIPMGKTVCVVGESGSGKSMTGRSILNMIPYPGRVLEGAVHWRPNGAAPIDLLSLDPKGRAIRAIRGKDIALISQEPMAALSPVHTIGNQMVETIRMHLGLSKSEARQRAVEMLDKVGIPRPADRLDSYAFELSGGMRQRVCIALAVACEPKLLIADEPTTALDVTTQANILDLFRQLRDDMGVSILFITHDLGVVAEIADEVVVMYLGQVVEQGPVRQIFHDPLHPYTRALLGSVPRLSRNRKERLATIHGMVPSPFERPSGCLFHPRCDVAESGLCDRVMPALTRTPTGRAVRCVKAEASHE